MEDRHSVCPLEGLSRFALFVVATSGALAPSVAWARGAPTAPSSRFDLIASRVAWPAGFPNGFLRCATEDSPEDRQLHERHAHAVAMQEARGGKPAGHGAIPVSLSEPQIDANGEPRHDDRGRFMSGEVEGCSGLQAQAGWNEGISEQLRNGDGKYALFDRDGRLLAGLDPSAYPACHKPKATRSHVFMMKDLASATGLR